MDTKTDSFGFRLRALIERRRSTVDGFADAFGIARSTAHLWLNREEPPLKKHWRPLADFFGVSERYIARGEPGPPTYNKNSEVFEAEVAERGSPVAAAAVVERWATELEQEFLSMRTWAGQDPERLGWLRREIRALSARIHAVPEISLTERPPQSVEAEMRELQKRIVSDPDYRPQPLTPEHEKILRQDAEARRRKPKAHPSPEVTQAGAGR